MNDNDAISKIEEQLHVVLPQLPRIESYGQGYVLANGKVVELGLHSLFSDTPVVDLSILSDLQKLSLASPSQSERVSVLLAGSLKNLTHLYINYTRFENPQFVGELRALNHLQVFSSNVDFNAIGNLRELSSLILDDCVVKDLSALSDLKEITKLDLRFNHGNFQDISPLRNLTKLEYLDLDGNGQFDDISVLSHLTRLKHLNVSQHKIRSISPLKNLKALRSLNLEYNQIADISPLEELSSLTELDIGGNRISDLKPVQALTNLEVLTAHGNKIEDIRPLESLPKLVKLRLDNNQIGDVTPLISLERLKELKLSSNKIKRFPVELAHLINNGSEIAGNPLEEPPEGAPSGQAIVEYYWKQETENVINRNKNPEIESLLVDVQSVIQKLGFTMRIAQLNNVTTDIIEQYEDAINLLKSVIDKAIDDKVDINYLSQLEQNITNIGESVPFTAFNDEYRTHERQHKVKRIQTASKSVSRYRDEVKKQFNFFQSIGFFKKNAVLVGANGSGKTSLSNAFRKYLHCDSIVVSSQRIMRVPPL